MQASDKHTERASQTAVMKAVVHREYGEPDVLSIDQVARPVPGVDDVLIRVVAAGASIGDHHIVTGKPYLVRLSPFGGFPSPRHRVRVGRQQRKVGLRVDRRERQRVDGFGIFQILAHVLPGFSVRGPSGWSA